MACELTRVGAESRVLSPNCFQTDFLGLTLFRKPLKFAGDKGARPSRARVLDPKKWRSLELAMIFSSGPNTMNSSLFVRCSIMDWCAADKTGETSVLGASANSA